MIRLAGCIDRGLEAVADDLDVIQGQVQVVRAIASTLDPANGDCVLREALYEELRDKLRDSTDLVPQQMPR